MDVVNRAALLFNTLQVLNLFFFFECLNYKLNGLKRSERQDTQQGFRLLLRLGPIRD